MEFQNKVRLPFYLSKPQYPVDEEIYVRANGRRSVLHTTVSKELEGKTDWMPRSWHERLNIALRHDEVSVASRNFTGLFRVSGSYDIDWQEFLDYPLAPAKFKGVEDGFAARSSRCNTCEEALALEVNDDAVNVTQGQTVELDVIANDVINCDAPVYEIRSFNANYAVSVTINESGTATIVMQPSLPTVAQIPIATYRVTCGALVKEGSIIASITGTGAPVCAQALNLRMEYNGAADLPAEYTVHWDVPDPAPTQWYYQLERVSDGSVLANGYINTSPIILSSLPYATDLRLKHYGVCQPDPEVMASFSIPVTYTVRTPDAPATGPSTAEAGVTLDLISEGEQIIVRAVTDGVVFGENLYLSGTVRQYSPYTESRYFTITIPAGQVSAQSFAVFGGNDTLLYGILDVSVYPNPVKGPGGTTLYNLSVWY